MNATVSNDTLTVLYETSPVTNNAIIINPATGALYVNGEIDADVPVSYPCNVLFAFMLITFFNNSLLC